MMYKIYPANLVNPIILSPDLPIEQRNLNILLARRVFRFFVARINMARDAEAGIVRQYTIQSLRRFISPIGNRNLTSVQRIANPDTTTVMK